MPRGLISALQLCVWICALLISGASRAHMLNMSEISLDVVESGSSSMTLRIDLGQSLLSASEYWALVRDGGGLLAMQQHDDVLDRLLNGIIVRADGARVPMIAQSAELKAVSIEAIENPLTPQMARLSFQMDIPPDASLEVAIGEEIEIPWPALVRIDHRDAELPTSRLLTAETRSSGSIDVLGRAAGSREWLPGLALAFQSWAPALTWVAVGFQHIIPEGLDHIVFVLGLFFLSTRLRVLLLQVSCFTVAHSITLACAMFGWVPVNPNLVEPLIAASIVYIAIDNLYSEHLARWRTVVVTLFGLLHGLGFAAALSELQLSNTLSALLLFNLGVELGQLAVILIAFMTVGWFRHLASYGVRVARPASVTIAGIGAYWFLKRTLGLVT